MEDQMKKIIISSLFLLVLAVFAVSCGGKDSKDKYDEEGTNDADSATEPEPDGSDTAPDADADSDTNKNNNRENDCNYSSADNRIKPKNEELVFSGIIFGELSLTKYIYVMNRCYDDKIEQKCDDSKPLTIKSLSIVDENGTPDAGTFQIDSNPLENGTVSLKKDEEIEIGVSVKASTWENQVRYLRITSNDKCKPELDIPLTAQTKPTGKIKVKTIDGDDDDEVLTFVDVIKELVNEVEVSNAGISALKLSSVSISEGLSKNKEDFGFFLEEAPEPGIQVAPGESVTLNVGCRNNKEHPSPLTGELLIVNTDPTDYGKNANKKIALKCGPNAEKIPTAKLKCEPTNVSVFQWAVMDGSESVDSDGKSKDGLRYLWSFATTPGEISLDIVDESDRAGEPLNGNASNKISRAAFQAKVKGKYTVRLVVINEQGITSKPDECDITADSDDDLAVRMFWNNKNADIDLHLINPEGEFGDPKNDCYYWNCSPQYSGERPDWGEKGETKDNPFLDIDNTDGIGPETVTINKPANGIYTVTIHAYDTTKGPSTVVVKAYAHGTEEKSASLLMNQTDTCWDVFTIEVSDGTEEKKKLTIKEITPAQTYECSRPTH